MKKLLIMGLLVGTLAFVSACGTEPIEPLDPGTDEPGVVDELEGEEEGDVNLEGEEEEAVEDLDTDPEELDTDPEDEYEGEVEDENEVEVDEEEE